MLQIKNISKRFKNIKALDSVSFSVNNGEIIGLLGENGAGKSTLLRIISTMLTPDTGDINIDNYYIKKDKVEFRKEIGILFGGDVGLYERLTARENMEYFAKLNGMRNDLIKIRLNKLIEQFEFADYADNFVSTFSKGMKQKVAIARSIVHEPSVILFDEPDSGLDFGASKIVFDFLKYCKCNGCSIIFSSHTMENIKRFSDRLIVLHKGKVVGNFDMDELRKEYDDQKISDYLVNLVCGGLK